MKQIKRSSLSGFLFKVLIYILALIFLIPVVLTVMKSIQSDNRITLAGYGELLLNCFPFYGLFWNSVIYAVCITFGTVIISIPAAFAFRFAQFRWKKILYVFYLILMMMPFQVMVLPNYIGLRDMGLLNTRMAIILPLIFSPFGVVVLYQYMREIDSSMVEAARLETNSTISIIIHCILPQIKVCVAAAALFVFADTWNMVEQPMLYLNDNNLRTLSTFIQQADSYHAQVMFPAAVLFMLPVFLCYLMFHEELKQGLKL